MNAVLRLDGGRVMLPKEYRDRYKLADRSTLTWLETKSGSIVLRPAKSKPELTLIEHLRRFQGVEIPEIHAHCPPRPCPFCQTVNPFNEESGPEA